MSLLDDIRRQPRRTREIMFALSALTTVLVVGLVWFQSFQKNIFVLLNPDQEVQDQFFAGAKPPLTASLFGQIRKAYSDSVAAIAALIRIQNQAEPTVKPSVSGQAPSAEASVHPLPVSGDRAQ